MPRRPTRLLRIAPLLTLGAACAGSTPSHDGQAVTPAHLLITGSARDAREILAARDTLNGALRERDVRPYARFWMDDVHLTGGNGRLDVGRDSTVRVFARFFADSSFVSGLRTPERVDVGAASNGRDQAAEAGRWVWRTRGAGGVTEAQGRYLVFWRRTSEGWRIRSELYVTTACVSGPGCARTRQ